MKPSSVAGFSPVNIGESPQAKPISTGGVHVPIHSNRGETGRHFEYLTDLGIHLEVRYGAPEIRGWRKEEFVDSVSTELVQSTLWCTRNQGLETGRVALMSTELVQSRLWCTRNQGLETGRVALMSTELVQSTLWCTRNGGLETGRVALMSTELVQSRLWCTRKWGAGDRKSLLIV